MAARRPPGKARLKLVEVGATRVLLVRLCGGDARLAQAARERMRTLVADEFLHFDGAIFRISHPLGIERVVKLLIAWGGGGLAAGAPSRGARDPSRVPNPIERALPIYDPNLAAELPGLANPWPIPSEPLRTTRPRIYMARVWHPDMAESLAFVLPARLPDAALDLLLDDFEMDFTRELPGARRWRLSRRDLDKALVEVVADHYEPRVHDILDRHFECWWDEFLAGEEWTVLPHPQPTQYPVRSLTEADFLSLEVAPYADIEDINLAYREKKEDYLNLRIPAEEWLDIDVAYQRIRRHHFPRGPDLPENVVAPADVVRRLRELLPGDERDRVRWFHGFCYALGAIPADLVKEPVGRDRLLRYLRDTPALLPGMALPPL